MSTAQHHFEKKAHEYTDFRETGILGTLVAKEKKTFLDLLPDVKNKKVLDIGCGSGIYTTLLKQKGANVTSLDFAFSIAAITKQKEPKTIVASLETVAFHTPFDVVLCWGPLEFVADQAKGIENIASLLKKDGILLVLYPKQSVFGLLYWLYHYFFHHFSITILSAKKLFSLLEAKNFIIESQVSVHVLTYALRCKKK